MSGYITLPGTGTLQAFDPAESCMTFSMGSGGVILTFKPDGSIVRGPGLSDDEATVAFVDCLEKYMAGFIGALRQRAESAERDLAALKAATDYAEGRIGRT